MIDPTRQELLQSLFRLSELTPDVRFGQATHKIPFDSSRSRSEAKSFASADRLFTKRIAKSSTPLLVTTAVFGSEPSNAGKIFGAATKEIRESGFMPSFLIRVVPE